MIRMLLKWKSGKEEPVELTDNQYIEKIPVLNQKLASGTLADFEVLQ